jgi:hypothetical protein
MPYTVNNGAILSQLKRVSLNFHQLYDQAICANIVLSTVANRATGIYLRIAERSKKIKEIQGIINIDQITTLTIL